MKGEQRMMQTFEYQFVFLWRVLLGKEFGQEDQNLPKQIPGLSQGQLSFPPSIKHAGLVKSWPNQ
jgi:hypothetical protein